MKKMSARYSESMEWAKNKEWFIIDEKSDRYILTDKAPQKAVESFNLYKQANNLDWNDPPVHIE